MARIPIVCATNSCGIVMISLPPARGLWAGSQPVPGIDVWPAALERISVKLVLTVSGSGLLIHSFRVSTPIIRNARMTIINNVTTAATTMLSIPAIISLRTSPFSKGFSVFFFISHLIRRIETGRDNIAHRIPIYAPFRKSTAIAATNEVVFRQSHDFTIITDHTQEFTATLLCSKKPGKNMKKPLAIWEEFSYNIKAFRTGTDFAPGDPATGLARGWKAPEEITKKLEEKKCLLYP